jgi:hypothetical protein
MYDNWEEFRSDPLNNQLEVEVTYSTSTHGQLVNYRPRHETVFTE